MTYEGAMKVLKGKRSRKVGNNTYLLDKGAYVAVKLHKTEVVGLYADGSVVLNSGGWRTVTTKARMNEYAPCRVYSKKHVWYVDVVDENGRRTVEFYDGMVL